MSAVPKTAAAVPVLDAGDLRRTYAVRRVFFGKPASVNALSGGSFSRDAG